MSGRDAREMNYIVPQLDSIVATARSRATEL